MTAVFVRHGLSVPDPAIPPEEWSLDPHGYVAIAVLAGRCPSLRVVCSDMRRAVQTAGFFGPATIDARLAEVARPFVDDPRKAVAAYLTGRAVEGWEPQADALRRIEASVSEHGEAIYVTHGTILALFAASRCADVEPVSFWEQLRTPDAWSIEQGTAVRVGTGPA